LGQKQRKRKSRRETAASQPVPKRPAAQTIETTPISTSALLVSVALAALIAIIYSQVRSFEFVYLDDPVYVVDNPWVRRGLSLEGLRWALTTDAAGNWHPLTWVSHMADIDLYGLKPGGHHVTSVILHIANSALAFAAIFRMTGGLWKSAAVAALFAIHPLHVESVAWVSERKDVLSTLFWMLTIHAYITYVKNRSFARYISVAVLFAFGLMSKPMLVTLPFSLLLLDIWPLRRIPPNNLTRISAWWPLVREKVPLFALTVFSMIVTVKVQRSYGAVVKLEQLALSGRVSNALVAYVDYLLDMFWPAGLAAFYPFRQHSEGEVAAALSVLIVVTVVVIIQGRQRPYLFVGWAWYIGTLIPAIGLIQVGDQARADRYTYVPAIGIFMLAVWGIAEIQSRWHFNKWMCAALGTAVIVACSVVTMRQVGYWRDNLSLFSRAVAVTERNYRAEALLGVAYSAKEQHAEAIKHYNASLAIWNGNAEVHSNLGASLYAQGKVDESLPEFSEAVRYKPTSPLFQYNYGVMLNEKGRVEEALEHVRIATELDPANKAFRDALELLKSKQKR
jgi:protein O-mannosyl-transferase